MLILPFFDDAPQTPLLFRGQDGIAQHFPEVGGHQALVFRDLVDFDGIIQFLVRALGRGGAIAGGIQLLGDVQLLVCRSLKGRPEKGFPLPLGDGETDRRPEIRCRPKSMNFFRYSFSM